jgi:flagellar secretion chaperone FliS
MYCERHPVFHDDPYQAYLDNNVAAGNPVGLVTALYEGAIKAVQEARHCLETGDIWGRSKAISRGVDILTELVLSLDHEKGGDISKQLKELYGYMQHRLLNAHARQEDEPMAEVIGLLTNLLDGWYKVAEKLAQEARGAVRDAAPVNEGYGRDERADTPAMPYGYDFAPVGAGSEVFSF